MGIQELSQHTNSRQPHSEVAPKPRTRSFTPRAFSHSSRRRLQVLTVAPLLLAYRPIVLAFWQVRALAVVAELGLPDLLAEGPFMLTISRVEPTSVSLHFFVPCMLWKA